MKSSVFFPADLTEHHVTNSAVALVDGELWPLHQPLTHSCSLTLLTFKDSDPTLVNQVLPQKVLLDRFHDVFYFYFISVVHFIVAPLRLVRNVGESIVK